MTPLAAAQLALETLTQLGIRAAILRTGEHQVLLSVQGADILQDLGGGMEGFRTGVPVYVDRLPIRYQLETGRTIGPHPS